MVAIPNKSYMNAIDALIPEASDIADQAVAASGVTYIQKRGADGNFYQFCCWTTAFHRAMNKLAAAAGLRRI